MSETEESKFVDWVKSELQALGRGAQSALARWLGVDRSQITALIKGRRQNLTIAERSKIIEFFASYSNPPPELQLPDRRAGVLLAGRIGNHWEEEQSLSTEGKIVGTPVLDFPYEEQLAYELLVATRDGDYRVGDFVYTVPFETYRKAALPGDEVIVIRRKNGLKSYLLQKADRTANGVVLRSVFDGIPDHDPLAEAAIVGLVTGSYRPRLRLA